jgi:hypothetical protein
VIDAAHQTVTAMGLEVATVTAAEGYLETRWHHPSTGESRSPDSDPGGTVRLRVWADLVTQSQSGMIVEAVYRRAIDPSLPDRLNEYVAAAGSPGDSLALQLREAVKRRLGTGTP